MSTNKVYIEDIELAKKSDIPDVDVFTVVYGQTTYDEITEALNANKLINFVTPNNTTVWTTVIRGVVHMEQVPWYEFMYGVRESENPENPIRWEVCTIRSDTNQWSFTNRLYQRYLESGVNIKTINEEDILGEGDLTIYYEDLPDKPDLDSKQDALVSGENIKTINNESILGPGNINIQGGGVSDYDELDNKPLVKVSGDVPRIHFGTVTPGSTESRMLEPDERQAITDSFTAHGDEIPIEISKTSESLPQIILFNGSFDPLEPFYDIDFPDYANVPTYYEPGNDLQFKIWEQLDHPAFAAVAASGSYNDLSNKPDIPDVSIFIATYEQTSYADVKAAIDAGKSIIVNFPNNKNLIIPTYCTYAIGGNITMYGIYKSENAINMSTITVTPGDAWTISHDAIQPNLVSGENIKTINGETLLGSGDVDVSGVDKLTYGVSLYTDALVVASSNKPVVVEGTLKGNVYITRSVTNATSVSFYGMVLDGLEPKMIMIEVTDQDTWSVILDDVSIPSKQDKLVSGTNIKTINSESLLDSGNLEIPIGDLSALNTENKDDLVNAINEVYEKSGEPFRVKQWGTSSLNVEIPYCTEDVPNTDIPKMTFSISGEEGEQYQIVGMVAYEVFDAASGGNRINCWPVCQFTGNNQKELSVRWMCGGTTRKTAKRISAWVLLKRRA